MSALVDDRLLRRVAITGWPPDDLAVHQRGRQTGHCTICAKPWPCPVRRDAEAAGLLPAPSRYRMPGAVLARPPLPPLLERAALATVDVCVADLLPDVVTEPDDCPSCVCAGGATGAGSG